MNPNDKPPPTVSLSASSVSPPTSSEPQPSNTPSLHQPVSPGQDSTTPRLHFSPEALRDLPDQVWDWLLKDAEGFAAKQIRRYRWRGAKSGVLPRGYDANSIAAQAITELFQPKDTSTGQTPADETFLSEGSGDFSPSAPIHPDVREAELAQTEDEPDVPETDLPKGWETECRDLQVELHHRVRRVVNRLWHLKERLIVHNLDDLAPVEGLDGETVSLHEAVPAPDLDPQDSLVEHENSVSKQHVHDQFYAFLGNERGLKSLYACLCTGVSKRKELARSLKVSMRVVNNRIKRLQHRAAKFSRLNSSEKTEEGAKKVAFQIPHLQELEKAA